MSVKGKLPSINPVFIQLSSSFPIETRSFGWFWGPKFPKQDKPWWAAFKTQHVISCWSSWTNDLAAGDNMIMPNIKGTQNPSKPYIFLPTNLVIFRRVQGASPLGPANPSASGTPRRENLPGTKCSVFSEGPPPTWYATVLSKTLQTKLDPSSQRSKSHQISGRIWNIN